MPEELPDIVADPLVLGVVHGDRAAWFQLTLFIEKWVHEHVPRHWRMRRARLASSADDVRDVFLETLERIDRDDFRALRLYLKRKMKETPNVRAASSDDEITFVAWLAALVDFAIRDHVRRRYGRVSAKRTTDEDPAAPRTPSKRSLQSWAVHPSDSQSGHFGGANPGLSRLLTARSILSYAGETFAPHELRFFERYLDHASFEELADEFSLTAAQARDQVRRLKERLRAHFRSSTG
jgi:DNA-directed RNA polymerase specialized sigma24 family protein